MFRYLITPSGTKIAHSAVDLALYTHDDSNAVELLLKRLSAGSERVLRPLPGSAELPDAPRYEIFDDRLGQAILGWLSRFGSSEAAEEAARLATVAASSPVSRSTVYQDPPGEDSTISEGTVLCLSGGGYRGMLFNLGALWRLNELGARPSSIKCPQSPAARLWLRRSASRGGPLTSIKQGAPVDLRTLS